MGFCRTCGFCIAATVAIMAVFVGALFGGHLGALAPLVLQALAPGGDQAALGMIPAALGGNPWPYEFSQLPDLTGKVALITGANTGLGYWTALHLAQKGATVHVGCRSAAKCEKAIESIKAITSSARLEAAVGDMSKLKSVRDLASSFLKSQERLDILVLNAGVGTSSEKVTEDNIEPVFATNHVGHQLLYSLLEDLLVKTSEKPSGDARVVVVSSASHFSSYEDGVALSRQELNARHAPVVDKGEKTRSYEQSKLANVLFAQEAAIRMRHKNVYVNSVHPGVVGTEFINNLKSVAPKKWLESRWVFHALIDRLLPAAWTSEEGALTQVYLAAAEDVRERDMRGRYFHPQVMEVVPRRKHCANSTLQKSLWKFTEALIAGKDQ